MDSTIKALTAAIQNYLNWYYEYRVLSQGLGNFEDYYYEAALAFVNTYYGNQPVTLPDDIPHRWVKEGFIGAQDEADSGGPELTYDTLARSTVISLAMELAAQMGKD
jgi:hypothetical protein